MTTLEDPRQFWPTLEQTQPALVLLDIEMPAVSGLELCHALRQHPRWRWLPIIVVSARQDPASVAQVRAAGAELLPKPVNGPHLLARIAAQVTSSGWDQAGPRQREGTDAVAPDRSATMPPAPTPTARAGLAPRGARILLADDDDSVAKVVATALGRAGHQVVRARTGAEALHLARHRPVDLILLDVQMPEGDGASVCRALRADPVLEQVPIILLSAQSDDATIRAGLAAGATDFLTKPFAIVQLRAHVDSWLRRAGADR